MGKNRQRKQQKRARKQRKRAKAEAKSNQARVKAEKAAARTEAPPEGGWDWERVDLLRGHLRRGPLRSKACLELAHVAVANTAESLALLRQAYAWALEELPASWPDEPLERLLPVAWKTEAGLQLVVSRLSLANQLAMAGRWDEARDHYQGLLAWLPFDPLGVRVLACSAAVRLGDHDQAAALCDLHDDDPLCWRDYTLALLAFAAEDPQADELLQQALATNRLAADMLTGERACVPWGSWSDPGTPDEAGSYALAGLAAWTSVPGAMAWLTKAVLVGDGRWLAANARRRLTELPRSADTWYLGWRPLPATVDDEPDPVSVLVVSSDGVRGAEISRGEPDARTAWSVLREAMESPRAPGPPQRPTTLVLPERLARDLAGTCAACGIAVRVGEHAEEGVDRVLDDLGQHMRPHDELPAWTTQLGVTAERTRGLCAAASAFFARTPWQAHVGTIGFVIRSADPHDPVFGGSSPCAVIMGAGAETFGLALYDSVDSADRAARGSPTGPLIAAATTLSFDPAHVLHDTDRARLRDLEAERPAHDVWPFVMRTVPGAQPFVAPNARQLHQLELALAALPVEFPAGMHEVVHPFEHAGETHHVHVERVLLGLPYDLRDRTAERPLRALGVLFRWFFLRYPELGELEYPCLDLAVMLCADRESPIGSGYRRSWAAGVARKVLDERGALGELLNHAELAAEFGVSKATATKKSKAVTELLETVLDREGL